MDISVPKVLKDLFDRINSNRGLGLTGLLANWELFSRAGELVGQDGFVDALTTLVEANEAVVTALAKKPDAQDAKREKLRQLWEKRLSAFLGFAVAVPLPPALNRKQVRTLKKYGFLILFIPSVAEEQYAAHMVRPNWGELLTVDSVERIPLAGRWVAVETIAKPNCVDKAYLNDVLMTKIGVTSRFGHPHSGQGEGDDVVGDLLPKVAREIGFDAPSVRLPSAEEWNFIANLFNWMNRSFGMDDFPDLGCTDASEWCQNAYGSGGRLVAGRQGVGALAVANETSYSDCNASVAFRVLVAFAQTLEH